MKVVALFGGHRKKLVLGVLVAALVLSGAIMLITRRDADVTIDQERVETVTILPVPAPQEGERLRDIPTTDQQKRIDFLKAGAASFNMRTDKEITQQAVASACVYDATAQIANDARASETYRNNTDKIKADVLAINQNCYAKYSDTDYVPPTPGPAHAHIDPNTLETHH